MSRTPGTVRATSATALRLRVELLEVVAAHLDDERRDVAVGEDAGDEPARVLQDLDAGELARSRISRARVGDLALRELALLRVGEREAEEARVRPDVRADDRAARVLRRADVGDHHLDGALGQLAARASCPSR